MVTQCCFAVLIRRRGAAMNRILVIGVSAGSGKSTFARALGRAHQIKVHHLDTLFWEEGWVQAEQDAFVQKQQLITEEPSWIIEGNYTGSLDVRLERADAIYYLEISRFVCLYRVLKRWVKNIGKIRPDLGQKEKMDWEFVRFILNTYHKRKKNMRERLKEIADTSDRKVVILRGRRCINRYLEKLQNEERG